MKRSPDIDYLQVKKVVPWRDSRRFFYWRLRRRLAEAAAVKQLAEYCAEDEAAACVR